MGPVLYLTAAQKIFPGFSTQALKGKFNLIFTCLKHHHWLNAFFRQPEHDALLRDLSAHPEVMGFVLWPYIHAGWTVAQRFEALAQHQQALTTDMANLVLPATGLVVVEDLSDVSHGLKLVVDRAPWCLREGSLVFSQFLNKDRLMSLAFSFGRRDGERVAYVGSIQGSNIDSALVKYREIAKDLHGMRSRDFLIKAFQLLTFHMGVKRVLCVSEQARHHRHPYFAKVKAESLHLNYDEIWEEHAGDPTDDGFFYLASLPAYRSMEDIAAKNRSLYRRRYALMDKLSAAFAARFGTSNPATHTGSQQP